MEHAERRRWCDQISKINSAVNDGDRMKRLGE
jgi:hypothetical protein